MENVANVNKQIHSEVAVSSISGSLVFACVRDRLDGAFCTHSFWEAYTGMRLPSNPTRSIA